MTQVSAHRFFIFYLSPEEEAMADQNRLQKLLDKANSLPLTPGVYIMKDAAGKVIYVGKSRKLKIVYHSTFRTVRKTRKRHVW
jgi:hypothetical protein